MPRRRPTPPNPEADDFGPSAAEPAAPSSADLVAQVVVMQRELDLLKGELLHSNRLAALGTVSATVAHEFNNLLTPAVSYATLALRELDGVGGGTDADAPDLALVSKALRRCVEAGERSSRVCEAILNLARRPPDAVPAGGRCEVAAAVEQALAALVRPVARDGIEFRRHLTRGVCVAVEPVQFGQVVLNLLLNARAAMLKQPARRVLGVRATRRGDVVRLTVSDSGCGIPPDRLDKVFEPFVTTAAVGGSGLGLPLCRRIVESHGGSIRLHSTPGKGTRVSLLLPAA